MKKVFSLLLTFCLVLSFSVVTLADNQKDFVQIVGGDETLLILDYSLRDNFKLNAEYNDYDQDNVLKREYFRAGISYVTDSGKFSGKLGAFYDFDSEENVPYAGIGLAVPFGDNLQIVGFYNHQYQGEKWNDYEAAIRFELYPGYFLNAGIMGDVGDNRPTYSYNKDNEGLLFVRGDFSWDFGKNKNWTVIAKPLLVVRGEFFHNYELQYHCGEHFDIVVAVETHMDEEHSLRGGLNYRF